MAATEHTVYFNGKWYKIGANGSHCGDCEHMLGKDGGIFCDLFNKNKPLNSSTKTWYLRRWSACIKACNDKMKSDDEDPFGVGLVPETKKHDIDEDMELNC